MEACIALGAHYLDITAEFRVYELAEKLSDQAAAQGVMLLPGVGWDVAPSDCLVLHVAGKVREPVRLRVALQVAGTMSRGSAASAGEIVAVGLRVRTDGKIVSAPAAQPATFDFGDGPVDCAPLSFGDLVTAWRSTGIPNIEMFVHVAGMAFPEGDLSALPDGPTAEERAAHRAEGRGGSHRSRRLDRTRPDRHRERLLLHTARRGRGRTPHSRGGGSAWLPDPGDPVRSRVCLLDLRHRHHRPMMLYA
ncbi:hypothetical protein [Hansschlegelia sp. KR7-227]|uniref:hypothetical protein n=1 Tax=Hansschlegelia sp. KR7-227 TaxID=3400914 RepID=UPI003C0BE58B